MDDNIIVNESEFKIQEISNIEFLNEEAGSISKDETTASTERNNNENECFDDTMFDTVAIEFYEDNIFVRLLGSLVAGLGLFLFGSRTSGLISQVSGYAIFIIGVMIVIS